jgi:hypothetical protein
VTATTKSSSPTDEPKPGANELLKVGELDSWTMDAIYEIYSSD